MDRARARALPLPVFRALATYRLPLGTNRIRRPRIRIVALSAAVVGLVGSVFASRLSLVAAVTGWR